MEKNKQERIHIRGWYDIKTKEQYWTVHTKEEDEKIGQTKCPGGTITYSNDAPIFYSVEEAVEFVKNINDRS